MRISPILVKCGLVASLSTGPVLQQRPVFRSGADTVFVDVSVVLNRRPVTTLTARDFEIYDRGVRQEVSAASIERMPLDVTVLLDRSQSVDDPRIASGRALAVAQTDLARALRPDDTVKLVSFASMVRSDVGDHIGLQAADLRQTSLFDAVVTALTNRAAMGTRKMIVVLTDGVDTSSSTPRGLVRRVAEQSDGVIHFVLVRKFNEMGMFGPFGGSGYFKKFAWALEDLVQTTGGRLFEVGPGEAFLEALIGAIEEFRHRYVLSFSPSTSEPGWHDLRVAVAGKGHDVKHRRGYWRQ